MTGRCRFCGCTWNRPCEGGCGWANTAQTICTACVEIASAWNSMVLSQKPNMCRAFAQGYLAAWNESEAESATNPYTGQETRRFWHHGYDAGKKAVGGRRMNTAGRKQIARRARAMRRAAR